MWQSLQHITEYRQRSQGDITPKITLPDELSEFYARFQAPNTGQQHKTLVSEGILDTSLTVSSAEVCMALRKTNPQKAAGPDNISGRALMVRSSELADVFTDIYNLSLTRALVPTCFKSTIIIPLPKKNAVTCLNDYSPIALTSIVMKCFESSAFNTVIPHRLSEKLLTLGLAPSLCNWVLNFLMDRPQSVRVGNRTSGIRTVSTGTPQGCVLSPLLYIFFTYDCMASQTNTKIIKFADDTTVIGLITGGEETSYRTEVVGLLAWCLENNLSLNTDKEIIDPRRKRKEQHTPIYIGDTEVGRVKTFKFFGNYISEDFTWSHNTQHLLRRSQQRLYFLRRLRKFGMSTEILSNFYRYTVESVIPSSITVWHGSCIVQDRKTHQGLQEGP
ncbi:hypothetical protein QTP86_011789 [Hemibagrus guttatus]|nr:hypothetical protein QTP86_011789 [Hemibagrus guttatus]